MMIFWIVAVLLIAAALLFLLPPLKHKTTNSEALAREDINILLYKDQLNELEADLKSGVLTQEQYNQAKEDLERSLLQDVSTTDGKVDQAKTISTSDDAYAKIGGVAVYFVGVFMLIAPIVLYQKLGAGEDGLNPENAKVSVQAEGHSGTIEEQVLSLQKHLQANPDDLEGWTMLARSYYYMKQYQSASGAFGKAVAMSGEADAQLLADYADALAMANGRSMMGKPFDMIKKALAIQPLHQKALWLAATAAYQIKDYPQTLNYYETLKQQFPAGSDNYNQMLRNIGEVKDLMGISSAAEVAELQAGQANQQAAKITGTVTIDDALKDKFSAGDTLFIYARAASGPKMPLAIIQKTAGDLPLSFTLDDSSAMNPAMKLSSVTEVVVSARISKTGNAIPQPGDLQGVSGLVKVGSEGLNIVITSAVSGSGQAMSNPANSAGVNTANAGNGGQAVVGGTVALDSSLQGRVSPEDTLFVFARAATGPRMPLAVLKKQVKDLPLSFTLDDSSAMSPQFALSKFSDVIVGARISKTGDAIPKAGDLKGGSSVIKVGTQGLKIIIDSAVP